MGWGGVAVVVEHHGLARLSASLATIAAASPQVEDEAAVALRGLGHHLSATAAALFRQAGRPLPLPQYLQGLHPLLQNDKPRSAGAIAPGLLNRDYSEEV
jgi:hypothetical protein